MARDAPPVNRWSDAAHALTYLARIDTVPHRTEGEAVLLSLLPERPRRVLDLGTGDGRLTALVQAARPGVHALSVDFSPAMLERVRARFAGEATVEVIAHDLDQPLPAAWGRFDAAVSSFAIHHLTDARKRTLFRDVFERLEPGGVFANLEHVSSPTPAMHLRFLEAIAVAPVDDDPSNKLASVEANLGWLREAGFVEVDCHWKWLELALLVGERPR